MSGAGDLLGTLGAVAASALAGYTRGQARGLQFQIQQQRLQQQAQGLQDYRQQLIDLQRQGQHLKESLAERQADQKELLRLTDLIQKKPHDLQHTGQLEPTLTQWHALYQKVHPGEEVPSFFGEQYVPAGPQTFTQEQPPLDVPAPPRLVEDATGMAFEPGAAMQPPLGPGFDRRTLAGLGGGGEFRSSETVSVPRPSKKQTVNVPAHFTGIPDIPLDEKTQGYLEGLASLAGHRAVGDQLTAERVITERAMRDPRLQRTLAETALALAHAQDVPQARQQAEERLDLLAKAFGLNRDRVEEYLRNNAFLREMAGKQFGSIDALRRSEIQRNEAYFKQQQGSLPPAVWHELAPLVRGYMQTDPLTGRFVQDPQREPFRRGIIAIYQKQGLDVRPFLKPGEPGYDPAYTLAGPSAADIFGPGGAPGGQGAPAPQPAPAPPPPEAAPEAAPEATYGTAPGAGPPTLPFPGGETLVHTDPAELADVGSGMQRWQYGYLPSQPGFSQPPSAPRGEKGFNGKELSAVNQWITDGSFATRLRKPKATLKERERLLRAYWALRGRPYRGP